MIEPKAKTFLLRYAYKGKWYCFDINADNWEQAEALERLSPAIVLDGQKVGSSVPMWAAPFATLYLKIKDGWS